DRRRRRADRRAIGGRAARHSLPVRRLLHCAGEVAASDADVVSGAFLAAVVHSARVAADPVGLQPVEPQTGERAPRRARDGSACRYLFACAERPLLACDEALWPVTSDATPAPVPSTRQDSE